MNQDETGTTDTPSEAGASGTNTSVGARLRSAREAQGRSLADISAATKVPVRMLEAIERMDLAALPHGPYATGFARSYARAVGLNAEATANDMRQALHADSIGLVSALSQYEPADPARVPPSRVVWISLAIVALVAAGYGVWRSDILSSGPAVPATTATAGDADAAAPKVSAPPPPLPAPTVTIPADAPVLISASQQLYFVLEDANGRNQFDLTLNAGEYYTVKANQRGLFVRTATPEAMKLVVGGNPLPPIGTPGTPLSGVGLDPASLSRIASGQWTPPTPATPTASTAPAGGLPQP